MTLRERLADWWYGPERPISSDIYECGELERDAAREAQFAEYGGIYWRLMQWFERKFRSERLALIAERDEAARQPGATVAELRDMAEEE